MFSDKAFLNYLGLQWVISVVDIAPVYPTGPQKGTANISSQDSGEPLWSIRAHETLQKSLFYYVPDQNRLLTPESYLNPV